MRTKAFTLIELLIVVAIIAILAAIAVPNFLEAQVRSKISASKADMKSIVTGLESYRVDHNKYPYYPDPQLPPAFMRSNNPATINMWRGYTPWSLTTPVAYMTTLPQDKFVGAKADASATRNVLQLYQYDWAGTPRFTNGRPWAAPGGNEYVLVGVGPDLVTRVSNDAATFHNNIDEFLQNRPLAIFINGYYDPTNGTVSSGDIVYHGPGLGFEPSKFNNGPFPF